MKGVKAIEKSEIINRWIDEGRTYHDLTASERDLYVAAVFGSDCSRKAVEAIDMRLFGMLLSELRTESKLPTLHEIVNAYSVILCCLGAD